MLFYATPCYLTHPILLYPTLPYSLQLYTTHHKKHEQNALFQNLREFPPTKHSEREATLHFTCIGVRGIGRRYGAAPERDMDQPQ